MIVDDDEIDTRDNDRMWPVDLIVASIVGVILYLALDRFPLIGKNWASSSLTYLIGMPVIGIGLSLLNRMIANRHIQKSIQLGVWFSVFVHLLLVLLAINVVIFSPYLAESLRGEKPKRTPVRKTVPEYLFQTPQREKTAVDWTKPTEAETKSTPVPEQIRMLPPLAQSAPRLELPNQKLPVPKSEPVNLNRRETQSSAKPQPSNSPSKAARPRTLAETPQPPAVTQPTAPQLSEAAAGETSLAERSDVNVTRREPSKSSPRPRSDTMPLTLTPIPKPPTPSPVSRQSMAGMPTIGRNQQPLPRRREQAPTKRTSIAGAAPVAESVAIARVSKDASLLLEPMVSPAKRATSKQSRSLRGMVQAKDGPGSQSQDGEQSRPTDRRASNAVGLPNLDAISQGGRDGGSRMLSQSSDYTPAGLPSASDLPSVAPSQFDSMAGDSPSDEFESFSRSDSQRRGGSKSNSNTISNVITGGPMIELDLPDGNIGLGDRPEPIAGIVPDAMAPKEVASFDFPGPSRPRRDVGGPITPAGSKIAAVESFSRRVQRTAGGSSPAPSGPVSAQSEEAIERGLAYLARTQNEDGSWSLQGHGETVLLRSDTAATGLALLAFQGAGYTHREHQYADTVGRGLQWLMKVQKEDGDLYRLEDPVSNRNVAFYSHGIAALAMSEAYGMTQDEEIKAAAQASLDFIALTQNKLRGGWRYSPQVSSDTSVTGWMMMALKSGQLSGLEVPKKTYDGIENWLDQAQVGPNQADRYRYDPFAPDTPTQRHGRNPTPTMTAVGMLMRMYGGWKRDNSDMKSAAKYLLNYKPSMGTRANPQRDAYYWYYATQVMFHMSGDTWNSWNDALTPLLLESQIKDGDRSGSWDPYLPIEDIWSKHAGRMYVTTMNLLNLEVYYRHLPIYEDVAR
jgi:Prenyltransferase and squalene oxidase repeat